jgi:hypothetical protein
VREAVAGAGVCQPAVAGVRAFAALIPDFRKL